MKKYKTIFLTLTILHVWFLEAQHVPPPIPPPPPPGLPIDSYLIVLLFSGVFLGIKKYKNK